MRRAALVIALAGTWWWFHHRSTSTHDTPRQGAVLADGFAARDGGRVYELDLAGHRKRSYEIPTDRSLRVFGTSGGAAAAWIKNEQLQLFALETREVVAGYGNSARILCDGVATNEARFAVAWIEDDGGLWFLHGPTRPSAATVEAPTRIATVESRTWCAVASAEQLITLASRDRDRLRINWCTTKSCSPLPASVKLAPAIDVVGLGCLRNACVVATRQGSAPAELMYVTESGAVKWRQRLASSPASVPLVGIGTTAFAVALPGRVVRIDRAGTRSDLWTGDGTPAIAWSSGRLLVATEHGETIIEVPR
jgi:hypothetical protein